MTTWKKRYAEKANARNRRALATFLRADGRRDEAFALLEIEDHQFPLYEVLAAENGRWDEVAELHRVQLKEMQGIPKPDLDTRFKIKRQHFAIALSCKRAGNMRQYDEAFGFAMECTKDSEISTGHFAYDHFKDRAPAKAKILRDAWSDKKAEDYTEKPAPPVLGDVLQTWRGGGKFGYMNWQVMSAAIFRPEKQELRREFIAWWKKKKPGHPSFSQMVPILSLEKDWQFLAGHCFAKWEKTSADAGNFYLSGYFLEKAGQVEEGERRMRLSVVMPVSQGTFRRRLLKSARENQDVEMVERIETLRATVDYGVFLPDTKLMRDPSNQLRRALLGNQKTYCVGARDYYEKDRDRAAYLSNFWLLNLGGFREEVLGLHDLENGRVADAEKHLAAAWSTNTEGRTLGAALVRHYRENGKKAEALRVEETYRKRIESYARELPGDPQFPEKLQAWSKACHEAGEAKPER